VLRRLRPGQCPVPLRNISRAYIPDAINIPSSTTRSPPRPKSESLRRPPRCTRPPAPRHARQDCIPDCSTGSAPPPLSPRCSATCSYLCTPLLGRVHPKLRTSIGQKPKAAVSRTRAHSGYHALLGLGNPNRGPFVCLQSLTCDSAAAYAAIRSISSGLGDPPAIRWAIAKWRIQNYNGKGGYQMKPLRGLSS
jgi:hypothetical protein